jgi:succinate dehydrogenase / fumarate reductase iron-sulfur subunit
MKFRIYRYDPESGAAPRMQDYDIDFDPKGKKVLDALIAIKDTLDESLSFRRSCREGVCGSDGVNVNGKSTSWPASPPWKASRSPSPSGPCRGWA